MFMQENPQAHARAVQKYWSRAWVATQSSDSSPTAGPQQPATPSILERERAPISPTSSPLMGPKTDLSSPQRPLKLPKLSGGACDFKAAEWGTAAPQPSKALRRAQAYLDRVMEKAKASCCLQPSLDFMTYNYCTRTATLIAAD